MPTFLEYLIKASLSLAVIYLFYRMLLKQMTCYTCNRYYLLCFSLFSFIVPAVKVIAFLQPGQPESLPVIFGTLSAMGQRIPQQLTTGGVQPGLWPLLTAAYIGVSFALLLRVGVQLVSVFRIRGKASLRMVGGVPVRHLPDAEVPFSFGNSIYLNLNQYTAGEQQEIIQHELVHIRQRHTLDVIIMEMVCIVNWFNPFAWLIRSAVRGNLEFIADHAVVSKGADRKQYQYLLLKVTGNVPGSITSNFSITSLKSRILMMNKARTPRRRLLRFVLLAPVISLVVCSFSGNQTGASKPQSATPAQTEDFFLSTLTYSIPDTRLKAIVLGASDQCLLKPGQLLDLSLVYHEKDRLKKLLEKNGYRDIRNNSIRFLIDTASVRNSFSVEVHINIAKPVVSGQVSEVSSLSIVGRMYCTRNNYG